MNRLTKSRRGNGGRGTSSASASAKAAGASASRTLPSGATAGVAIPASHTPSGNASPFGGWFPPISPSEGLFPTGGFSQLLQSNPFVNYPNGNDFNFVGDVQTPSPTQQTHDIEEDVQEGETVNVDDESRTEKRLNWMVDDDLRLASAWLRQSKDPVDGNDKKSDAYWNDVTDEYNKTAVVSLCE